MPGERRVEDVRAIHHVLERMDRREELVIDWKDRDRGRKDAERIVAGRGRW